MYRTVCLALFVLAAMPSLTAAQGAPAGLERGERIRVFSENIQEPLVATFVSREEGALLVRPRGESETLLRVYMDRIERVERRIATGGEGAGFLRGAMLGAGASQVGGLILQGLPSGEGANTGILGGILMAPVGALVG